MFLFFSINQKKLILNYNSKTIVHDCGKFGKATVYMIYSVFYLFFIPIFKWNKKYFVEYSCCKSLYELDKEVGKEIENGNYVDITKDDLKIIYNNYPSICNNCGATIDSNYSYCPHCGNKL